MSADRRLTEHKYKSSYERIGKAVLRYSTLPKMHVTNFFMLVQCDFYAFLPNCDTIFSQRR